MGISEIEAFEHALRHILGEPVPDALFREVAEEVELGTLCGCVAQAPNLASLSASVRYLIGDLDERIEGEQEAKEKEYLKAVREKLIELEREFGAAVAPLGEFLNQRVVKGHFRLHERFPAHSHDS
jgi:hypothetical protein